MFTVAILGRPNVGKSTLFNRLVGKKLALVHDTPGLTRDWRAAEAALQDLRFQVIDTAGLEESFDQSIEARMRRQTEAALAQADMVFFVIDARAGLTPLDRHFADFLRRKNMRTVLLANKCESEKEREGLYEAHALGFGTPIPVSAEHGLGMSDLYDLLQPLVDAVNLGDEKDEEDTIGALLEQYTEGSDKGFGDEEVLPESPEVPIKIAIVGQPNAGKSTLLNALLGEHRAITGPEPGLTRDAIHADFAFEGRKIRLVDTAGLRKRARVVHDIERMAVQDTLRAIRLAQVVILVIDATVPFERQDLTIAGHVLEEGRGLVIAINKWDQIKDKTGALEELQYQLKTSLAQAQGVPLVTFSALTGQRVTAVMAAAITIYGHWTQRVPTGRLNRWLQKVESRNPPPMVEGRPNRLRYITQIKARPPTFALWVSRPTEFPDSYERYMVNSLRQDFDLPAVPVRFIIKTSKNPYQT